MMLRMAMKLRRAIMTIRNREIRILNIVFIPLIMYLCVFEIKEGDCLAPFLMTYVDIDATMCKKGREKLLGEYPGYLFCPGHGAVFNND